MASITTFFGITGHVPFVDVDVESDTKLFLDPALIAFYSREDGLAGKADQMLRDYSALLCTLITSSSAADRQRAYEMLMNLNEPRETRLGMSAEGFNGHGVDTYFRDKIGEALTGDLRALIAVGVFHWIGALPLFVEDFDRDRMSDMTTAIIRGSLIDFTEEMIRRYPQFQAHGHLLVPHTMKVWDPMDHQWKERTVRLPHAGGHPLLLVPDEWAGSYLQLHGRRYYAIPVLGHIQEELRAANPAAGKVSKKDLEKMHPDVYPTNLAVTMQAYQSGIDLLEEFIRFAHQKLVKPAAA